MTTRPSHCEVLRSYDHSDSHQFITLSNSHTQMPEMSLVACLVSKEAHAVNKLADLLSLHGYAIKVQNRFLHGPHSHMRSHHTCGPLYIDSEQGTRLDNTCLTAASARTANGTLECLRDLVTEGYRTTLGYLTTSLMVLTARTCASVRDRSTRATLRTAGDEADAQPTILNDFG